MAVGYHSGDLPSDYGLNDWHHDADGKVNYSWCIDGERIYDPNNPKDWKKLAAEQDNSYRDPCSEETLQNLDWQRNHRSSLIEGFEQWERNQILYN